MNRWSTKCHGGISKEGSLEKKRSQALVEFAIVVPVFMLILLGLIDFSYYFFAKQTMHHAIRESGRLATTGRILYKAELAPGWPVYVHNYVDGNGVPRTLQEVGADINNPTRPMSREQAIQETFKKNLMMFTNAMANFQIFNYPGTNSAGSTTLLPGPGQFSTDEKTQYVMLIVSYPVPTLTRSMGVLSSNALSVAVTGVFINEAWSYTNVDRW